MKHQFFNYKDYVFYEPITNQIVIVNFHSIYMEPHSGRGTADFSTARFTRQLFVLGIFHELFIFLGEA
jgi:hypothetical protein